MKNLKPSFKPNISHFAKDHFSLLLLIESLQFESKDGIAKINIATMRCNPTSHPLHHVNRFPWKDSWGTKLKGFSDFSQKHDIYCAEKNNLFLSQHDDWDCLEDLEKAGLLEIVSFMNGYAMLTQKGIHLALSLRQHKLNGGTLNNFEYSKNILPPTSEKNEDPILA